MSDPVVARMRHVGARGDGRGDPAGRLAFRGATRSRAGRRPGVRAARIRRRAASSSGSATRVGRRRRWRHGRRQAHGASTALITGGGLAGGGRRGRHARDGRMDAAVSWSATCRRSSPRRQPPQRSRSPVRYGARARPPGIAAARRARQVAPGPDHRRDRCRDAPARRRDRRGRSPRELALKVAGGAWVPRRSATSRRSSRPACPRPGPRRRSSRPHGLQT
jgi:hypothetical protein